MKSKITSFFNNIYIAITDGFQGLEGSQKKSLSFIVKFFAIMVVFTIVARGTASATLPVVTTGRTSSATIRDIIESSGAVKAEDTSVIGVPTGVRISKGLVLPGADIKEGDPILSYDKEEVDKAIDKAKLDLKEIELNIQAQNILSHFDDTPLDIEEKNLDWEKDDYDQTLTDTKTSVSHAKEDLNDELRKRDEIKDKYKKEKRDYLDLGHSNYEDYDNTEYKAQLKSADKSIEQSRRSLYDAEIAAGKSITEANRSIERAELNYEASKIKSSESSAQNSVSNSKQLNEAAKLRLNLAEQKDLLEVLNNISEADYKVASPYSGKIIEILMLDGIMPSGDSKKTDYLKLSQRNSDLFVEMELDEKDAKTIKVGSKVKITDGSNVADGIIRSVALPDKDKKVVVTTTLPDAWPIGTSVTVAIPKSEKKHSLTLPLSAIYEDNMGNYIYILQEEIGVLGVQTKVIMTRVTLIEKDKENAAISGALSGDEKIVVSATKPLSDYATVRTSS